MSELLWDMRLEDISGCTLLDDDDNEIPKEFIDKHLDVPEYQQQMKSLIRFSVLEHVTRDPKYFTHPDGEYAYTAPDTYDHSYMVDNYIQALYAHTQTKTVYQCSHCNSDNVQVKAWVRPNQGMKYVDEVNEGDEMGWCDDCGLSAIVDTVEVKRRNAVTGFQVWDEKGEMHPHMDASFCVYSLPQAKSMIDDNNQGQEQWNLLTIWIDTVEEPTMMFEGDPREPRDCTPSDGTKN